MPSKKQSKALKRNPKTQKALATKEVLLKAATQILLKEGLDAINTNLIAEKAGVSIGTLYQYFTDKEEIIAELLFQVIDSRVQKVKDAISLSMVFSSMEEIVDKVADALIDGISPERAILEMILLPYAMMNRRSILFDRTRVGNEVFMPILKLLIATKAPGLKGRSLETVSFVLVQATRAIVMGRILFPEIKIADQDLRNELKTMIVTYLKGR